ncbi:MAG: type II secretion system inner membrane protein GspF [Deltaproteobacteria bacterium]|nr:type II secretion system inner membrane protein GspF [Deltaproteobacteria bacterium]
MAVYEYQALDKKGKNIKGIVDAASESQARDKLRSSGKYPVSLKESRSSSGSAGKKGESIGLFERVKSEEIGVMTRQLATLLGAGIPLIQGLSSLVNQTNNPVLKKVIAQIKESVNEGNTLTQAIGAHPKLFSPIYVNMVRAGEASGSLDVVLEKLADFGEKQEALKGRLRAALIYPVFMAFIGTGILFILITYIVPNITQVFNEMDKVLPAPTLFLLALSDVLKKYWWALLIGAGIGIFFLKWFVEKPYGRSLWDLAKLKSPVVGPVIRKVILARFASTLGSLLGSGVGLMTSMKIVRTLVDNVHVAEVIEEAMNEIQKGENMSDSLSASEWFPPMFVQMIAVGEQSGNLEEMLKKVAKAYEREVESAIMGMTSLIEPIMIVAMGAAVGFVVLSILLPIFEMNQMIG